MPHPVVSEIQVFEDVVGVQEVSQRLGHIVVEGVAAEIDFS